MTAKIKKIIQKGRSMKEKMTLHEKINHHICHYYHKHFHIMHHSHHTMTHIGELIVLLSVGCMSRIFAWWIGLPNNMSFVYPLQQVSTIDCRTENRSDMNTNCKISLPHIVNANYNAYKDSVGHQQIYSVLRAWSYTTWRDQTVGAHAGVDIATARGTPLYSMGDGEVTYAGRQNGYGNVVKIKYLFQGKYVHAIYAHMDTIEVEAWNKMSAGQRIGTVWHSGVTFGALGWFHIHLEINKDNQGRPMYAYLNCADLKKGDTTIVEEWLCREELISNQYDPIVVLEQNRLGNVIPKVTSDNIVAINTGTIIQETGITIQEPAQITGTIIMPEPIIETPATIPSITETQQTNDTTTHQTPPIEIEPAIEEEPIVQPEVIVEKPQIQPEVIIEKPVIIPQTTIQTGIIGDKIEIETKDLSEEIKHFFGLYDLYINNHTGSNILNVGRDKNIELNFYRKWTTTRFIGVLPFVLDIIASQTHIVVDYTSIQLIADSTKVNITGRSTGTSVLIISIIWQTIIKIPFTIQ